MWVQLGAALPLFCTRTILSKPIGSIYAPFFVRFWSQCSNVDLNLDPNVDPDESHEDTPK